MMEVKLLEVRDIGTCIPLLAVRMGSDNEAEQRLLWRVGYPPQGASPGVMITALTGERKASADPYFWGDRTFTTAHFYITQEWAQLTSGDVVDVEFILGERTEPKLSEIQR